MGTIRAHKQMKITTCLHNNKSSSNSQTIAQILATRFLLKEFTIQMGKQL
uniref:Uncharacterized protein n=1 Tax=Rhizophora mucronata TaxID=61149 RepID=A0A2P2NPY8_RHIMU